MNGTRTLIQWNVKRINERTLYQCFYFFDYLFDAEYNKEKKKKQEKYA